MGIASIVALDGLYKAHRDYVSAAVFRAFFTGVLLFVLCSPILYFMRKKEKKIETQEITKSQKESALISWRRVITLIVIALALGLIVGFLPYIL